MPEFCITCLCLKFDRLHLTYYHSNSHQVIMIHNDSISYTRMNIPASYLSLHPLTTQKWFTLSALRFSTFFLKMHHNF